jgi:hypothetical protein
VPRPFNIEAHKRVEELFYQPQPTREIVRLVRTEFGVTSRTVRRYLQLVREKAAEAFKSGSNPDAVRHRAETMLIDAYHVARANDRAGDMILAAQRLAEIHGAFRQKVDVDGAPLGIAELLGEVMRSKG